MTLDASPFLDLTPSDRRASASQLVQSDAPLTGVVSAVVDAARGLVEVVVDGSDLPPVVASADAGLTYVGARVSLPRDSSGRVIGVRAPAGVAPAGVEVVPVGEGARRILASEADIARLRSASSEYESAQEALATRVVDAEHAAASAQALAQSADARLTVSDRAPGSADASGRPDGSVWEARSGETLVGRWVLVSGAWTQVWSGADVIAAGAIGAREITASQALWAKLGAFQKVITAAMLAGSIVLQSDLIAGDAATAYVILNGSGMRAFRMIGGQLVQVWSLGTGSADYLSVTDAAGNAVATINESGGAVFREVNAGSSLLYQGRELSQVLDDRPRGVVGFGAGWPWSGEPRHALHGEESIFEATLTMEKGRLYSLRVFWGWYPTSAGSACEIRLRHTSSTSGTPASPTSSTSIAKTWRDTGRAVNQPVTVEAPEFLFTPSSTGIFRWLISAAYAYNTGVTLAYDAQMPTIVVEDLGPMPPMITAPSKAIAPSGAAAPSAKQRRSKTFYSSGYRTFVTNGGYPPSTGPGHGSYGSYTYQSMIFFPNMTADLSGATILNAALYVHANHFYATSGNTLALGMHGATSDPGSFQSKGQWAAPGGWTRGEERWIQIPSSLWQGLKDGGYRGITLEAGSSYGYTYPAFAITVDYVK